MKKRLKIVLLLVFACAALYMVVKTPPGRWGAPVSAASAQYHVTAREAMANGSTVGEVVANDEVLFRIRTSAGGYIPMERAQLAADRLNHSVSTGALTMDSITTGRVNGMDVVLAKGQVIATADAAHARLNQTTPMQLASYWATRVENIMVRSPVAVAPVAEKIVPIISVGSGTRLGGALVSGASDRLKDVKAVAQLEGSFQDAVRVRVLIPVSTENVIQKISRVPETSVIGLVDVKL